MGKRTTQLNEITTVDNNDILYGVDVDDLTHSPDGTSVKFKKSNLLKEVNSRAGDIESDVSELQGIISGLLDQIQSLIQLEKQEDKRQRTAIRGVGGVIGTTGTTNTEVTYDRYTATNLQPYIVVHRYRRIA